MVCDNYCVYSFIERSDNDALTSVFTIRLLSVRKKREWETTESWLSKLVMCVFCVVINFYFFSLKLTKIKKYFHVNVN